MDDLTFLHPLLREFEQLQRDIGQLYTGSSIRAGRTGTFPAVNIGSTDQAIEILALVPGIDPSKMELTIDKGMLTLSGERTLPALGEEAKPHAKERFAGKFRRVIELPEFADPARVDARYSNGCLAISVAKRAPSSPTKIAIQ